MKLLNLLKRVLAIAAIVWLFIDWRISVGLIIAGSILHAFPLGPNALLSVLTGYSLFGGIVYLFVDWRIGVGLIIAAALLAIFRIWANRVNEKYYNQAQK